LIESGLLLINKQSGQSSASACNKVKQLISVKKIGHTGTLDPFATGLLITCLNRATKIIPYITPCDKKYLFTMTFGIETNTLDSTGNTVNQKQLGSLKEKDVIKSAQSFIGDILQEPPLFSALKLKGKPLYKYARAGEHIDLKDKIRTVSIKSIELKSFSYPQATFEVKCGHGTYIRSLARDIAFKLDTVAHVSSLTRLTNGDFHIDQSIKINDLATNSTLKTPYFISLDQTLNQYSEIILSNQQLIRLQNGQSIEIPKVLSGSFDYSCTENKNKLECLEIVRTKDNQNCLHSLAKVFLSKQDKVVLKSIVNLNL